MNSASEWDGIIIGGGHNAMTLAGYMLKARMRILILERRQNVGGALETKEVNNSGFYHNIGANFHVFADVAPPHSDLDLEAYGVRYAYPEVQNGMPTRDGRCLLTHRNNPGATAK